MKWKILFLALLMQYNMVSQANTELQVDESPQFQRYDKFEDFSHLLSQHNDTTYVVNFWATWCRPCVAELPYFEELAVKNLNNPIKVILVSLDFKKQIESKFKPFLRKHQLTPSIVLLTDGKASEWIDKVSPEWSGAIPATYIYKNDQFIFAEEEFESLEEIEAHVLKISKS